MANSRINFFLKECEKKSIKKDKLLLLLLKNKHQLWLFRI